MRKARTSSSESVCNIATYFLLMMKPKLVVVAFLMVYYFDQNSHVTMATVHAEVSHDGQIQLSTPTKLLSRIEFEKDSIQNSDEAPAVGPFIGNPEFIPPEISIKKKNCVMPSVVSRGLIGSTLKRSYLATSADEVKRKIQEEKEVHRMRKRNVGRENSEGGGVLPWTCETNYEWKDLGADHYPRFVRTAECKSKFCVRGFYRCKPRRYKTKILKRNTDTESNSCDENNSEDDVSLPESLRSSWKFITVQINLCCDCTGPGEIQSSGNVYPFTPDIYRPMLSRLRSEGIRSTEKSTFY